MGLGEPLASGKEKELDESGGKDVMPLIVSNSRERR
jgi:hypothetical protein